MLSIGAEDACIDLWCYMNEMVLVVMIHGA